ncbi:rifin [Plasmodium sp. gorilla clade G1]|nr:rifin [Plasmodium sp. gorilla clade G1]
MKMHYYKILLICLPLNILVLSSYVHSKNKLYMMPHTRTATSRVLSECDIETSIYDNDPDMKYVKENFDRQTSQRFEEYEERMIKKRQKCKEQCEKDIKQIILKDKIDKSVEEKIEKGCLRCGCGLGGIAAGVGIIGAIAVNEMKKAALVAAAQKGIDAGITAAINTLKTSLSIDILTKAQWMTIVTEENFMSATLLGESIRQLSDKICVTSKADLDSNKFCLLRNMGGRTFPSAIKGHAETAVKEAVEKYASVKNAEIELVNAASSTYYTAIIASVVAIVVIVLVMVIIYLILRYRRKKKTNKKLQYTKLLNQ